MAVSNLITEDGNRLVQETVRGITGASQLNDTSVATIVKETFTVDPLTNGWLIGSGWQWNSVNDNMEIV